MANTKIWDLANITYANLTGTERIPLATDISTNKYLTTVGLMPVCLFQASSADQFIAVDGMQHTVTVFNQNVRATQTGLYNASTAEFVAPVTGVYLYSAHIQVEKNTLNSTDIEALFSLSINGYGTNMKLSSSSGVRWFYDFTIPIYMNATNTTSLYMNTPSGFTGSVKLTNANLSVVKIATGSF